MVELTLQGSAYDRGREHGQRLASETQACLSHFKHELRRSDIKFAIERTIEFLDGLFPEITQEIRGIADGAEAPFADVFLFNNRAIASLVDQETCSDIAVAQDGQVLVGMNKDRPMPIAPYDQYLLRKVYPEDGYAFIGYGHVGRIWGHGMNDQGLCTAGTAAYPLRNEAAIPAFGSYLLPPLLLSKCRNVAEALELIERIRPVCDAGNFMLCDASGEMVVMEMTSDRRVLRPAENGHLIATTYFSSGQIEHKKDPTHLYESQRRYQVIENGCHDCQSISLDAMKTLLRKHDDEGPVCRHCDSGVATVFSWIASPAMREFYFCPSAPCEGKYQRHTLVQ